MVPRTTSVVVPNNGARVILEHCWLLPKTNRKISSLNLGLVKTTTIKHIKHIQLYTHCVYNSIQVLVPK